MSNLEPHLADLAPHRSIERVVRAAAKQRDLEVGRRADYVSLRPPQRTIACYVHASRLSIAMDPAEAANVSRDLPVRLEKRNPATTYVVVEAAVVSDRYHEVLDLIVASIDWRAAGQHRAVVAGRLRLFEVHALG